jgi:hypothetical protein
MSAAPRDRESLDLIATRRFGGAALTGFEIEMQARRMHLRVYGELRGDGQTYGATVTFFGVSALVIENETGIFPESVLLDALEIAYSDSDDIGSVEMRGRSSWTMAWSFDGIAYQEAPAVVSSYRDDL